ncbi:hypothetical protein LCGC14_0356170 [marine sediment metagenome]|uniref:Uncharacterized protein n=1 Tax=marine sediment metagenome TaxID=412755 RepID=A0A0F9T9J2_9ZZZZ
MARVDRTGTFRFTKVLEAGISTTGKKEDGTLRPWFNVRLALSEFYDETEGEWVPWEEYEQEITARSCLFGMDKKKKQLGPLFTHQQVMDVFGWDGKSFQALATNDYTGVKGQVIIADNDPEYADKNPYQTNGFRKFDSDPGSRLRKLEGDDLKKLDAQFASVLQTSGSAPVAVSAPAKPKIPPKTVAEAAAATVTEPKPETAAEKKVKINAKAKKLKAVKAAAAAENKKPGPPARTPAPPTTPPTDDAKTEGISKQDAWEICVELKSKYCTDEQLSDAWNAAYDQVTGGIPDDGDVMPEQWRDIKDATLDEVGVL